MDEKMVKPADQSLYDHTFARATVDAKAVMAEAMSREARCFGLKLNLDPEEEQGEVLVSIKSVAKRVGNLAEFWPALKAQGFEVKPFGDDDVTISVRKEVADLVKNRHTDTGADETETQKNYVTAIEAYRRAVDSKTENVSAGVFKAVSFVVGMPTLSVSCSKATLENNFGADDYESVIACLNKFGLKVKTLKRTRGDATGACTAENIGVCISADDETAWENIQAKAFTAYRKLMDGENVEEVLANL